MPQKQQQESDENSYQPWREEDLNKLDKLKKAQIAGASDEGLKKQIRESYGLKWAEKRNRLPSRSVKPESALDLDIPDASHPPRMCGICRLAA